jgi:hypothetical protein
MFVLLENGIGEVLQTDELFNELFLAELLIPFPLS